MPSQGRNVSCTPEASVGCAYLQDKDGYRFSGPEDTEQLVGLLRGVDEVVSSNGKRFELLVLQRHYACPAQYPLGVSFVTPSFPYAGWHWHLSSISPVCRAVIGAVASRLSRRSYSRYKRGPPSPEFYSGHRGEEFGRNECGGTLRGHLQPPVNQHCLASEIKRIGGSEHPTRPILGLYPDIRLGSARRDGSLEAIPKG